MSSHPVPRYPAPLQTQITHAGRFARALRMLHEKAATDDAAFLWLEGRAEEVEVLTIDVLRAWSAGELATGGAAEVIHHYLHELHGSLAEWYGAWYAPSCCGPLAREYPSGVQKRAAGPGAGRRADTLLDTVADAPPADMTGQHRGAAPVAVASMHAMAPGDSVRRSARVG